MQPKTLKEIATAEELGLQEVPFEKEFYILVDYYNGDLPYPRISEELRQCDVAYKVKLPIKHLSKEEELLNQSSYDKHN